MLEAAMEKMKKDHGLQMKQKDDLIHEISQKGGKRVVTKGNLRPKETETGELKSPSSRFMSPAVREKKRSFLGYNNCEQSVSCYFKREKNSKPCC
ncbi:putative kinesin-like protein [Helianthus anomalus]